MRESAGISFGALVLLRVPEPHQEPMCANTLSTIVMRKGDACFDFITAPLSPQQTPSCRQPAKSGCSNCSCQNLQKVRFTRVVAGGSSASVGSPAVSIPAPSVLSERPPFGRASRLGCPCPPQPARAPVLAARVQARITVGIRLDFVSVL